jgi:hypothetical protein
LSVGDVVLEEIGISNVSSRWELGAKSHVSNIPKWTPRPQNP